MAWQGTPYTAPMVVTAIISILLASYVLRRRAPGARSGAMLLLATAVWTLTDALDVSSVDLGAKLFWSKMGYFGIAVVPVGLLLFALRYSGRDSWITTPRRALLFVVPACTILVAFTNDLHGLLWSRVTLDTSGSFSVMVVEHGPWFLVHVLYSYSMVVWSTLMFLEMLVRSRQVYRWQATGLVVGALVPWFTNALYVLEWAPPPRVDTTPLGFSFGAIVLAWTITRLRRGDIVSVSRGSIIESMGDGVIVLDVDNRIVELNPAAQRLVARPLTEVVGRPIDAVWPSSLRSEGASGTDDLTVREMVLDDDAGQRTYDLRVSPLKDWRGRLVSRVVVLRDITERKRMERALQESEGRFRRLAENAQDIIYRYEFYPRRGFTYVSPSAASISGYTPEEHYEDPDFVSRLLFPEDSYRAKLSTEEQVSGPIVVRWRHKEGRIIWVEMRNVVVHDDDGKMVAIEGVVRDVTERQQLEGQLLRAQRLEAAGRIAGQVAHDFNNLLGPLVAYPELIKMQLPEGHSAVPHCDAMLEAAERMADINEDMLALGRRGHFDEQPVDLNGMVEQAVSSLAGDLSGLVVDLKLAGDLLPASGSPAQLSRVLANLVSNAREAMRDAGVLTVRTENVYVDEPFGRYNQIQVGEYVRLTVSDTGYGIAPEIREKIFDAFFTTKQGDKRRGCGLGLSVVQAIVDDHHGYLDLESEVGKGTSFSVYLPTAGDFPVEKEVEALRGGNETILVVDDDQLQRQVSGDLLRRLGYQVESAASGEEGLRLLRVHPADLVILDMIMPGGMDGAETYRRILEIRPGQRALVVSGFAQSDRVQEAQRLGAGGYLRKPVSVEKLSRAVREELDRKANR